MICLNEINEFHTDGPTAVSLGKFDGVHKGHDVLIRQLLSAKEKGLETVVFTFDIPPKSLTENNNYRVLSTNEEKKSVFEQYGIDYLLFCPFTKEIMNMEPEDFVDWLVTSLHVKRIVVGSDFCFGHNRRGNHTLLAKLSEKYGYKLTVVNKLTYKNREISSSYVREEILKGEIETANELLGYPFFVGSEVVHGRQLGRKIGIPTINMKLPAEKILPLKGVYVTKVLVNDRFYAGVTNVGCKPTVNNSNKVVVETHLLDFAGDLYGMELKVFFFHYIRPERKFESVEALRKQMEKDIGECRKYGVKG